jgi:hypothetical protein
MLWILDSWGNWIPDDNGLERGSSMAGYTGYGGGFQNRGGGGWGGNTGFAELPPVDDFSILPSGMPINRADIFGQETTLVKHVNPLFTDEQKIVGGVTASVAVGAGLGHLAAGAVGSMVGAGLGFLLPLWILRSVLTSPTK